MTTQVLFVVPTFNRARDLPRTLGAIAAQDWPDGQTEILVVDNSSSDDTPQVIADLARTLPCKVTYHRKAPEGPTVVRNIGLRRGIGGYVALVDSDVELTPGWTAATVGALDADPAIAQVSGPLVFAHDRGTLNSYGGALGPLGLAWDRLEGAPASDADTPEDVLWLNTAAVLFRPEPALAVGGFDEAFFYGYEEPDLGVRLAIAGWRSRVVPAAVAVHHTGTEIGASAPEIVFHYTKNRFRMGLKSLAPARLAVFLAANVLYGLADAMINPPRGARLRAMGWNLRHLPQTLALRRQAQAQRRVRDKAALSLLASRAFPPRRLAGLRRRPVHGNVVAAGATDDRVTTVRMDA